MSAVKPPRQGLLCVLIVLCWVVTRAGAQTPAAAFGDAPHNYWTHEPQDAFSQLLKRLKSSSLSLDTHNEKAALASLLRELKVPVTSQLLVYSATSLQAGLIRPSNPRALYFSDEVYVGFVPGGRFEVAAIDPQVGPVFQIVQLDRASGRLQATRTDRCMNCHAGATSNRLPGFTAESVIVMPAGGSLEGFRREQVGHTIPLSERLGGWVVTGAHEHGDHLGNLIGENTPRGVKHVPNPPGKLFSWDRYPVSTSDLFNHLVHEHQLAFHNFVTLGQYRTREALAAGKGTLSDQDAAVLDDIARRFVRYILFQNEARLPPGGIKPDPAFARDFAAAAHRIKNGASLRDTDLRSRMFRYRCSYLIHTPSFAALPDEFKKRVLAGLGSALRERGSPPEFDYIPQDEKRAISTILRETGVMP